MTRVVVFVSGRGSNLAAILKAWKSGILQGLCDIVGVVSNRATAGGITIAQTAGLPTIVREAVPGQNRAAYDKALVEAMAPWSPQVIVLAGFDRILSPVLVQAFPNRIVNIHPADPSEFRGLHGYQWAYEQKLPCTKVTVHLVDEGVDTGPVLEQREVDLTGVESLADVEARGLAVEHELYPRALARFFSTIEEHKEF